MATDQELQFSKIYENLADSLDVPEGRYREAEERYRAVGEWLNAPDTSLSRYDPEIYVQGSFRLGTAIRPISEKDEYDVDLVCKLKMTKKETSQKELKKIVGDRLKENSNYSKIIEEGRRCWTLKYAESTKFHMDILPSIPETDFERLIALVGYERAQHAIEITDRELYHWQPSNPVGYYDWFIERMGTVFFQQRSLLVEQKVYASVEDVPVYAVKTPLQRAIQILKRHRDIVFEKDLDNRPISVIITTLASHAYGGQSTLFEALKGILAQMPDFIDYSKGIPWVGNPSNPDENFANKWEKDLRKRDIFLKWVVKAREDFEQLLSIRGLHNISESLRPVYGKTATDRAFEKLGTAYKEDRTNKILKLAFGSATIGSTGDTTVRDHTFYGS